MRAHQIMTRRVITVQADTPITEAAKIMLQQHVSGLPVVDQGGKLVGIVSEGDFIRRAEIGTETKRGGWLRFLIGPGQAATEFVRERGRTGSPPRVRPCAVMRPAPPSAPSSCSSARARARFGSA